MQKTITPLNKTDLKQTPQQFNNCSDNMQPSDSTLQKILQFAANYRVQKISDNQYIEMNLS
jgi:hypothetical protein